MKTITLVAYRRPAYTDQALHSLRRCQELNRFDRLDIFIDPGYDSVRQVCEAWAARMPVQAEVHVNTERLGVARNPLNAYCYVFDNLGSDFHVAIEDDAVLSPDALRMALWFYENQAVAGDYLSLNFCDHMRYRGPGKNRHGLAEDPSFLAETRDISSPFGWCFPRRSWPFVKRHWDKNRLSLPGWDWSLRFGMRIEGKVGLTPVLSRCRNIGRFEGTWENGETFQVQLGLNYSDGSYYGDYEIVESVPAAERRRLDAWMIAEIPRLFSEPR
jgi:hypothetical protein